MRAGIVAPPLTVEIAEAGITLLSVVDPLRRQGPNHPLRTLKNPTLTFPHRVLVPLRQQVPTTPVEILLSYSRLPSYTWRT